MRSLAAVLAALPTATLIMVAPPAAAGPTECHYPSCTPGIMPNVVLGANCSNTTHYVFGVTSWGRLVFCGSPRRYEPRWFRAPEMHGIKDENSFCPGLDGDVAQAPDGLFLTCVTENGSTHWERGDT